jgi:nicotinamide mononucleotide transporter
MIEFLFSQYKNYPNYQIALEIIAILFGLLSVWFAKKNNILVYPTGIVNTAIYVYLLYQWSLLGDMMINFYYVVMSIYGWYNWTKKNNDEGATFPIATMTKQEYKNAIVVFVATILFVLAVYWFFDKFTHYTAYIDTFVTGIFLVGMWLMAKRKIENWIFWIIGDLISIPMYYVKGYTFTSIQYIVFTIIAFAAYTEWKKNLVN